MGWAGALRLARTSLEPMHRAEQALKLAGTRTRAERTRRSPTGRYHSKSEVLREGVRLIQERETRLAALDASIARGVADADMGRLKPASEVFDLLEAKLKAKADRR